MGTSDEKYLIVFKSSSHAMLLYNEFLKLNIRIELIATPCTLSRGCSQSIVFNSADSETIIQTIKTLNISVSNIYRIFDNGRYTNYIAI